METDIDKSAKSTILRIRDILLTSRRPLVVTHVDPDGDALGTQLALGRYLKDIGKNVVLTRDSKIPAKYRFLPGVENITSVSRISVAQDFDVAIVLECPQLDRLGAAANLLSDGTTIINIDHHRDNTLLAEVRWVDAEVSSVGELVYSYFQTVGYDLNEETATQLYTAILTDTGRFRFQSTTPQALAAAADLVRAGADPRTVCDNVYYDMDPAIIKLTGLLLSRLEYYDNGRTCIMAMTKTMLAESGADLANTEGLVDYSLYTQGVEVGVLMREADEQSTKISLRSRGRVDVAAVAAKLGGGGHPGAAGCRMARPMDDARQEIVRLVREACESQD